MKSLKKAKNRREGIAGAVHRNPTAAIAHRGAKVRKKLISCLWTISSIKLMRCWASTLPSKSMTLTSMSLNRSDRQKQRRRSQPSWSEAHHERPQPDRKAEIWTTTDELQWQKMELSRSTTRLQAYLRCSAQDPARISWTFSHPSHKTTMPQQQVKHGKNPPKSAQADAPPTISTEWSQLTS